MIYCEMWRPDVKCCLCRWPIVALLYCHSFSCGRTCWGLNWNMRRTWKASGKMTSVSVTSWLTVVPSQQKRQRITCRRGSTIMSSISSIYSTEQVKHVNITDTMTHVTCMHHWSIMIHELSVLKIRLSRKISRRLNMSAEIQPKKYGYKPKF